MVYCAWRIIEESTIICTWHGDSESVLVPALQSLEAALVTKATISEWGDLLIHFSTGRTLQIWNDAPFSGTDSWSIGYEDAGYYSVEPNKGFVHELGGK